ncbi:unnamed protein product [Callosobruchus maculatus]|uniref:C2H2-type domain-containing protein n=1 Tax=Callosobruchus maculatus TaxID=64391 RepID=A0A653BU03_CALMS|nr:unnamed protein product [Callosobruchus maculatus]
MVKILKVEDLKNVDIVERIRRDLGQQMFASKRSPPKIVSEIPLKKESKYSEIQQTATSLVTTSNDRPVVKILKVEDLKSMDIVERIRKDLGQQMFLGKRDSPKIISELPLKKENKDPETQKTTTEEKSSLQDGGTDEPTVKILKVEDLKNLEIVERIRKDVPQHMFLAKRDSPKMVSEERTGPEIKKTTSDDKTSQVASTSDGPIVKILKVEDLKNVDIVERIRKDLRPLKKENRYSETQKVENKQSLVDSSTDEPMVKILKVEDLRNVDVVERIGKDLGQQMLVTKRDSSKMTSEIPLGKGSLDAEIQKTVTEGEGSRVASGAEEPMVKILKVEDLKNMDIVERIQKEGAQQTLLAKQDSPKIISDLPLEKESIQKTTTEEKPSLVANSAHEKSPPKLGAKTKNPVSNERWRIFLKLTASDVKPAPKKKPKCELPWPDVKKPVDTTRCHKCAVLYQTDILKSHKKVCKGKLPKCKYSCAQCSFSNTSYSELADHVKEEHSKKT